MNPFVSCVMPARGRKEWTRQAIESYLAQTYEPKELIVLQDEDAISVTDDYPTVRVVTTPRHTIPEKRNALTQMATGPIIANFDSDDWSRPERLAEQVSLLVESRKAMTGFHSMLFWDGKHAFHYRGPRDYVAGTSLVFLKEWALAHPFPVVVHLGSDVQFIKVASAANQLVSVDGGDRIVARIHQGNSNPKNTTRNGSYHPTDAGKLPEGFPR